MQVLHVVHYILCGTTYAGRRKLELQPPQVGCLKDDGLFLLHTIGSNTSVHTVDPWVAKYIFPNSMLPSARQITEAAEGIFILEDWHSFGPHYDPTLMAWHRNFLDNWQCIQDAYDQRFQRMWVYYLLSCAGSFRSRRNQLWQIVFSKNGSSEKTCQDLNRLNISLLQNESEPVY